MDLSSDIYGAQSSFNASDDFFSQEITSLDRNTPSTNSIRSNVSHTCRGSRAYASAFSQSHRVGSISTAKRRRKSYKLRNSKTSQEVVQCTCRVRSGSVPSVKRSTYKRKKASISNLTIATNTIMSNNNVERKCLSYLQQSDTPTTDIDVDEAFELIQSEEDEPHPNALCTVYGGSESSKSSVRDNKNGDDNDANHNSDHKDKGSNGDNNKRDNNGSGSHYDGHEDKSNDGDDDKNNDIHDEKISLNKALDKEDIFYSILRHLNDMNPDQINKDMAFIGDDWRHMIQSAYKRISALDAIWSSQKSSSSKPVVLKRESVEPIKVKSSKRRKAPKQKKQKKEISLDPDILNTKSGSYTISKDLTEVQIPERIVEVQNMDGIYPFVTKLLAINKDHALELSVDKFKEKWRIFNFDLHEINHEKDTKETAYFIARKKQFNQSKWRIDEIMSESKITSILHVEPHLLPSPSSKFIEAMEQIQEVKQRIMEHWQHILKHTKWHKIIVYKATNNIRRMKLFWNKPEFVKLLGGIMEDEQILKDINPIPIIMFGANDECIMQYVFEVPLEDNVDIGIAFECYPSDKRHKPKVAGFHVDKELLRQQHHIVCPPHIRICTRFKEFKSQINDIYIGNPDDILNQKNALQHRLDKEKIKCKDLEKQLSDSLSPLALKLSTSNSICSNAPPLLLEETRSKSLSTISERRDSLIRTYLPSMSPSVSAHQIPLSPLIIPMTKCGSLPENDLEVQSFPDLPKFPNGDQ